MNLHCQRRRLDWILTSKHSISERKKGRRGRRETERERERAQMGEIDFANTQTEEERERMTLFTFLDLCEEKRQKKWAYYLFFF
jgi:hypothetical protein